MVLCRCSSGASIGAIWMSVYWFSTSYKSRAYALIIRTAVAVIFASIGRAYAENAPLAAVGVSPIVVANVAPSSNDIGHIIAIQSVKVVPRVTAFIEEVNVAQGSMVRDGELLFSLQKAQFQAALQMAQASLASAQAALINAEVTYERAARLNHTGFEAQSNVDQALAARDEARATVLAAAASVQTATLNLGYCTITAPIAGRIGAVAETKGNLVTAATGSLATINQLDPIRVVFSVNSGSAILASTHQAGGNSPVTTSGLAVALDLPNGQKYPYSGKIAFFDNHVDTQTGTVNVYADFPNPTNILLPGAYVSVVISSAEPQEAPLVPVAAVQTDQNGEFVLIVGSGNKVEQRSVTLGEQIAQNFIVKKGLGKGDRVIIDGAQKVKVGEFVNPTVDAGASASDGKGK
jgi:membrane fusion protein, multidrug efflux system